MLVIPMKRFVIALAFLVALPAFAQQTTPPPETELIMNASGEVVAPWTKGKTCTRSASEQETCKWVILNGKTREIARVGDTWATKFAPTGKGLEVRRLETSLHMAQRLAEEQ